MALSIKDLLHMNPEEKKVVDNLEKEIDADLGKNFLPYKEEYKYNFTCPLNQAQKYALAKRYRDAGWDGCIIGSTPGEKDSEFILHYKID
jgi:hypothetical protein